MKYSDQLLRITSTILMLGCLFFAESLAEAQTSDILLSSTYQQKESIIQKGTNLGRVLKLLEGRYNVVFLYRTDVIQNKKVVETTDLPPKVEEALKKVLKGQKLKFEHTNYKTYGIYPEDKKAPQKQVVSKAETVSGQVTDASTGETLPGVNIRVKGTSTGTSTDANGQYELTVESLQDTLVFSFVGYKKKTVPIDGRNKINVALKSQALTGEELVVVGYGEQQRKDLTGSVSTVDAEQMKKISSESLGKALEGAVAGLTVQSTGAPGEPPSVKIHGVGSFGNNEPLYVIDGVPVQSIEDFNMQDVKSVEVLKGPSSSAIYGSRAANGVVIITTKTGRAGDVQVDYSSQIGYQDFYQRLDLNNAEQYREIVNQAHANVGLPLPASTDPNSSEFVDDVDTDWQEKTYQSGLQNDQNLTISGGDEENSYSIGLGYINKENTFTGRAPAYKRYSARIKSHHEITDKIRVGQSMFYSKGDRVNQAVTHAWALTTYALKMMPIASIYDESKEGGYAGPPAGMEDEQTLNPVGANNLFEDHDDINRFLGNIWGEYDILDNLTYKLNISYDNRNIKNKYFVPRYNLGVFFLNNTANLTERSVKSTRILIENTLNYQASFGDHNINVLLGYTEEHNNRELMQAYTEGFSKPYFEVLDAGTENIQVHGNRAEYNLRSYLGRLNYNYDDRYLVTASVRRDGSSRFAENNKYGVFPSASVGWRISEESFFNVPFVNDLKIRAGYGKLGNQEIGNYQYLASINTSDVNYNFNNTLAPGAIQAAIVDPNIKWEAKATSNFGIDISMLNNRLKFTADYYNSKTKDLLVAVPIPPSVGSTENPTVNAASLKNSGVEFEVSFSNVIDDLSYSVDANVSSVNNKVLSLGGGEPIFGESYIATWSRTAVGREVGELYGYISDGIFQNQQEVDEHAFQSTNTAPGDIRFKDLNNDGIINAEDRQYMGSVIPDFTFGFGGDINYKSLDLSLRFIGNYGNKIFNDVRRQLSGSLNFNQLTYIDNYWTPDNRDTNIPRPTYQGSNENNRESNRFVEDGSFLRLRNFQLGYTVAQDFLDRIGVRNLRFDISIQNVFTITKYKGFDPALGATGQNNQNDGLFTRGVDSGSYPHPRIYTVGIQLGI